MNTRVIRCVDCSKDFRHALRRGRPPLSCERCRVRRFLGKQ